MDLSKLPRMSRTPPRAADVPAAESRESEPPSPVQVGAARYEPAAAAPAVHVGSGAEVWLSVVLGVICLLLGMRFARWLVVTVTGGTFSTGATWTGGDKAGQPVGYFELQGYAAYTDMAFFLFGMALVLEGLAIMATSAAGPGLRTFTAGAAMVVTAAATLFNLGLAAFLCSLGGVPIPSLLMVAFGGYMTVYLYRLWSTLRAMN